MPSSPIRAHGSTSTKAKIQLILTELKAERDKLTEAIEALEKIV